jgi:predicted house-cleaning noncanonical NTP pyrophosphatase (MazG superfamily)
MGKRLVRDLALKSWTVPGAEHQVHPVESIEEHKQLLNAKLLEEAGELIFANSREELIKEIADVLTVLEAIAYLNNITWQEALVKVNERIGNSGGFITGMVWETSR